MSTTSVSPRAGAARNCVLPYNQGESLIRILVSGTGINPTEQTPAIRGCRQLQLSPPTRTQSSFQHVSLFGLNLPKSHCRKVLGVVPPSSARHVVYI